VSVTDEGYSRNASFILNLSDLSELLLFNTNAAIFEPYHGENKLIFNEMMMTFSLH
jgi:hypothetical protein